MWGKLPKDQDVPFDSNGNQLHYPEEGLGVGWEIGWKLNFEFTDTLTFGGYHRGRSAAYFEFVRKSTGTTVTVFLRDLETMLWLMQKGEVCATFTFCKVGMNYGCKVVQASSKSIGE